MLLAAGLNLVASTTPLLAPQDLAEDRRGLRTRRTERRREARPQQVPPPELFTLVRCATPSGPSAAYLSVQPASDRPRPAVVWLTGEAY